MTWFSSFQPIIPPDLAHTFISCLSLFAQNSYPSYIRQNRLFCLLYRKSGIEISKTYPLQNSQTLDKTMNDRKHLVAAEVEKLIAATKGSRNEARDRCLLLLMFRHGLRVSEACGLQLAQVDIESRVLHVERLKKGLSTTHPLRPDELRSIKAWLIERKVETGGGFFLCE